MTTSPSLSLIIDPMLDIAGYALVDGMSCKVYRDRNTDDLLAAPLNAPLRPVLHGTNSHRHGRPAQLRPLAPEVTVYSSIETAARETSDTPGPSNLFQHIVLKPFLLVGHRFEDS